MVAAEWRSVGIALFVIFKQPPDLVESSLRQE
jgi:hypothetical protein